jgi:DNA-binding NtrC family response regulator
MAQKQHKILIVDDDPEIVWYLTRLMDKFGIEYDSAGSGEEALEKFDRGGYDLMLLDITMPGISGIDVLRVLNEKKVKIPVIILSAYENVNYAVESTKLGAYDYLVKPVDEEKLRITVLNALKTKELEAEVKILRKKLKEDDGDKIISQDDGFMKLIGTAKKIAEYDVSVLVIGESGTGKELVATAIHNNSLRKDGPFVSIDCATLPDNLVESELFGHEKGSFTGATESKTGRFEMANGGTLFLDEIGNLSVNVQKKLLRVLQERKIVRIGGKKTIDLDIRVITATNVDLKEAVKKGEFREDLYHRINEFYIELPPLRMRGSDIVLLTHHFIEKYNSKFNKNVKGADEEVMEFFMLYDWPGNVRELENAIKHAIIMAGEFITKNNLPKSLVDRTVPLAAAGGGNVAGKMSFEIGDEVVPMKESLAKVREQVEREIILKALAKFKWNKTKVAEALQVDYKTLYNKMKEYGM